MTSLMGRARIETAAMLLAVFIAGGLGGAALERRARDGDTFEGRAGFMRTAGGIPSFFEELDLTDAQRAEIETILEAARPETDELLGTALPRLRQLAEATRQAITGVLTEGQRAQLDANHQKRRDRSRGSRRGRGGGRAGDRDGGGGENRNGASPRRRGNPGGPGH